MTRNVGMKKVLFVAPVIKASSSSAYEQVWMMDFEPHALGALPIGHQL
jgi:hypothetical protein